MGATETFDPTDGTVHTGTLDANCTFTLNAPVGSGACLLELRITASGTRTWTWPGSVTWIGGTTPDAPASGETAVIGLETLDGGTSWLGIVAGGGSGSSDCTPFAHGSMGSTETLDPADGQVHTGTLTADLTVTLTAPACDTFFMEFWATQDGTGGWDITWPGGVTVNGTPDTTAGTTTVWLLDTVDGGTSWVAFIAGGSSGAAFATPAIVLGSSAAAGAATTVIRSDATIAAFDATVPVTQAFGDSAATGSAAFAARRDHVHGMPTSPSGSGGASEHAHVASETHLSNGSTTTWTLDQAYEPGSVIAWNTTALARLDVTEVLPDQATVSAAGSSGDKIVFDYAATVA
jgi:hypothetical protein